MIAKPRIETLSRKYYYDIYKFCCSYLEDDRAAEDVTQEVFLLFIQKAETLEETNIRSWLFGTAVNKTKENHRHKIKQSKLYPLNEYMEPSEELPDIILDLEEPIGSDLIEYKKSKILAMLTPEERALLECIYEKHMKFASIGEKFGISESAATSRSSRLKAKIIDLSKKSFIFILFVLIKLKLL